MNAVRTAVHTLRIGKEHVMSQPTPLTVQQVATQRHNEKNEPPGSDQNSLQKQELSPRQHAAIELLLHGQSDAQVAQQLGIDRVTVFRWRKGPRFARELER